MQEGGRLHLYRVQEAEQRSSKKLGCEAVRLYTGTTAQVSRQLVTRQEKPSLN